MNSFFLVVCCVVSLWAHRHLVADGKAYLKVEVQETPKLYKPLERFRTLGFFEIGADKAWIQFVNYFGDRKKHAAHYPELFFYLERIQAIDPYFLQVYQRIGLLYSLTNVPQKTVLALLKEGEERQPQDWLIPFLRASLLMQSREGVAEAAAEMRTAAARPHAPSHLGLLAVRLATAGGELESALAVVDQLESEALDETTSSLLKERKRQINYEQQLLRWKGALKEFRERPGEADRNSKGDFFSLHPSLPRIDPWGGAYVLDEASEVSSENSHKRLQLRNL